MKKIVQISRSEKGFTLVEVIITIIVAAILGSFLITFMGTAVTRSADPIIRAQNLAAAGATMERITADYVSYLSTPLSTPNWVKFKSSYASQCTMIPTSPLKSETFETIECTVSKDDQKLVSYFMK